MHDVSSMCRTERAQNREQGAHRIHWLEPPALVQTRGEFFTLEQFHDDVGLAIQGLAAIEDPNHAGIDQPGRGFCLEQQALLLLMAGGKLMDQFDRDANVERIAVGLPHDAHPTSTDKAHQAVLPCDQIAAFVGVGQRIGFVPQRATARSELSESFGFHQAGAARLHCHGQPSL
jgi:hypothetical protein